ncbi:hypothetical protein CGZ77_00405 [Neisseria sp. KEM232]|nr:hypothetical protein CGZ77_00405 [Neisseria sp. KEM232]
MGKLQARFRRQIETQRAFQTFRLSGLQPRAFIVSQNRKDTRQQAADSMGNTARRSNAVYFLFWLTIKIRQEAV